MQKNVRLLLFLTIITGASCGVVKRGTIPWEDAGRNETASTDNNSDKGTFTPPPVISAFSMDREGDSKEVAAMKSALKAAYDDWKGVPYRLGGYSFNGVDCSAFMQIVFRDYLSSDLPRTTEEQLDYGQSIKRNQITTGDMVFFKTGRRTLHVGVMVNEQEFMHASTSSGVMISGLQERYWQDVFLTVRRIL
ncbi:NlpC/P60 family protein [Balneola sp. MJW-20]|uniref:NlpC/P60 family protein n=1 Tax=Gracilimonas aurantiaca TaxID=3234185 RepID=UPI0034663A7A